MVLGVQSGHKLPHNIVHMPAKEVNETTTLISF